MERGGGGVTVPWRGFLPAVPATPWREMIRAAVGASLGLFLADLILWALAGHGPALSHSLLIAPFGASAYLIFAVPNSPLAQPWPVVIGNTLSAIAGLFVVQLGLPTVPAISLAVLLAMLAMASFRALHPPAGGVAIAGLLAAPGPEYILLPVLAGSVALVGLGMAWNHLTGRVYPFRLPSAAASHRPSPGPLALASAIGSLRMGANLGVEDLARLIAAAEAARAAQNLGPVTAADLMSRDLITLRTSDDPSRAADLFRQHRFRHLPLLNDKGTFVGLIPVTAVLGPAVQPALATLVDDSIQSVAATAPLAALFTLFAQGRQVCIPVVEGTTLKGLITRSDLLVALTHGNRSRKDPQ